jgi:hypothetical protein
MQPLKTLVILIPLILISGCAATRYARIPLTQHIELPSLNSVKSAELGDTIVSKGTLFEYEGIDLKEPVSIGDGFWTVKIDIPAQKLVAKMEDKRWVYYYGNNVTITGPGWTMMSFGGLKIYKKDLEKVSAFSDFRQASKPLKQKPFFEYCRVRALEKPTFIQELIYNGRVGDQIKFLYREIANEAVRAPFTQEVQYDLSEGHTIGFKGARIEIVEASNTNLKYKVLANFPTHSPGE